VYLGRHFGQRLKSSVNQNAPNTGVSFQGGRMDITWVTIGKILVAGFATYILLPGALVFRDQVLWKVITTFILNDKLRSEVRRYARLADTWNKNYVGKKEFGEDSEQELFKHLDASQKLQDEINKSKLYIDRQSRLISLLLKHYKHEAPNPIADWKKQAKVELEVQSKNES
jgi:hypothetical protein